MYPLRINSRVLPRVVLAVVVGSVSVVLAGLFVYEVYAQPISTAHNAAQGGTVYLTPSSQVAAAIPSVKATIVEMHIANNGLTYLRGARVVSVSGSTIRTEVTLGAGVFVWNIESGYSTQFYNKSGAKGSLSDVQSGDYITVTGKLSAAGTTPVVSADVVRE